MGSPSASRLCSTGILLVCLPVVAFAQTRGMRVVIKDKDGRDVGAYGGSYALVVGVSRYTHGWPALESVPGEVGEVARFLGQNGFSVTEVLDPDSDRLENAFEDFIDAHGYDPDNRLLFFFSGHGYTLDDGRRGYLVPTDAPDPAVENSPGSVAIVRISELHKVKL